MDVCCILPPNLQEGEGIDIVDMENNQDHLYCNQKILSFTEKHCYSSIRFSSSNT